MVCGNDMIEEEDVVSGARDGLLAAEPLTEHWTHLCFISLYIIHPVNDNFFVIDRRSMTIFGDWFMDKCH